MPNEEVKLYMPDHIVRELEVAAEENPLYTRNEVAIDVLRTCLPIWRAARRRFGARFEDILRLLGEEQSHKQ